MPSKKKLYILHGWSVDQENKKKWETFIEELANQEIEAIFLGIPGLSSPLDEVWQLDDFVKWLGKQLPETGKHILLGHSFGGQIAIRFSALFPERVDKLVLINSAGIRDHAFWPTLKRRTFLIAAKIGKFLMPFPIFKTLLYKIARERDYVNAPPLLKRTMSAVLDQEVVTDASKVKCQTLIIWGENDTVTPLKLGKIFNTTLSQSELKIIPDARHSPQFTHPKQVAGYVKNFV